METAMNMNAGELADNPEKTAQRQPKNSSFPWAFNVRGSCEEEQKVKKLASVTGKSLSRLLIETTLGAPVLTHEAAERERADREEMIFELRRISVNLSQITSVLHAAGRGAEVSVTETQLAETAAEIEAAITELKKRL